MSNPAQTSHGTLEGSSTGSVVIPTPNLVQLSLTVTRTGGLDRGLSACSRPHVMGVTEQSRPWGSEQ